MIETLAVWIGASAVSLVYGWLTLEAAAALTRCPDRGPRSLPITALVGVSVLAAVAAALSLFAPLGPAARIGVALGPLLALGHPRVRSAARRECARVGAARPRIDLAVAGLVAVAVLIALERTAGPVTNYDTGLYHGQAIRWIGEYGVVPGLGNLHGRLAFSSAWFVPAAALSPPFAGSASSSGFSGLVFVCFVVYALAGLRAPRRGERAIAPIVRLALLPWAFLSLGEWLSSPSPDVGIAILMWTVALLFLDKVEDRSLDRPDARAAAIFALTGFAIAVKLTALPLALLPIYLATRFLRARRPCHASVLTILAVLTFAPHVARTTVASGYPLYPVPRFGLPGVDWKIPEIRAYRDFQWVRSWARHPRGRPVDVLAMSPREWMPGWFGRMRPPEKWALVTTLLALPVYAARSLAAALGRTTHAPAPETLVLPAALVLGLIAWLSLAPDPRFGWGLFYLLPVLLITTLARAPLANVSAAALIACAGVWLAIEAGRLYLAAPDGLSGIGERILSPAEPPLPDVHEVRQGAMTVWAPRRGDQCWYAPLPCTPYPSDPVTLRGASLESGFRWTRD